MPIARMIVPFANGSAQFPGLPDGAQVSWAVISYAPPPPGTAPYVLVELNTTQANITTLTNRADCLYLCAVTEAGFETANLPATERNAIRTKIANMGFTGAQYGLLNAAIQSSQNRDELVVNLATRAFFRNVNKDFMTEEEVRGGALNRSPN